MVSVRYGFLHFKLLVLPLSTLMQLAIAQTVDKILNPTASSILPK
ncbi:hypothetical protein [Gloeocapsopsis crepidinum]|nr:hypothetical protein [Gloeocapsopsis crepidinum]